jgi:hypothetical protein
MLYCTHEIPSETEKYARERLQNMPLLPTYSFWHSYQDVPAEDWKVFLSVLMNMAVNDKAEVSKMPFFKDLFSLYQVFKILWIFHLCPCNSVEDGMTSRVWKINCSHVSC